jgi:hypothetical protein
MSWSVDFLAENKVAARSALDAIGSLPPCVKEFLLLAIDGLNDDGLIQVKSNGHLATTASYQVSTHNTEVKRLHISAVEVKS